MENNTLRLGELYKSNKIDISVELYPPKTDLGIENLFDKIESLKKHAPVFFSVTYGASGTTRDVTLELVDRLKNKENLETMCHMTVVGQSKEEIRKKVRFLKDQGIYNIMALRGDPPLGEENFQQHSEGFQYAIDLVKEAKKDSFFSVAVAGFPEIHPDSLNLQKDIFYLKEKVDAGADIIISQLFFDNKFYLDYLSHVRNAGIEIPVIPGILPILSVSQIKRFTSLCKATIPSEIKKQLEKYADDDISAIKYGIDLATKQCEELIQAGVPGIHFYALNKSHSVDKVLKNLKLNN